MPLDFEHAKIFKIFQPTQLSDRERIFDEERKFVHYTTAESALEIIRTKSIWMRSTQCMNDYTEVETGIDNLIGAFQSAEDRDALFRALDACTGDGFTESCVKAFDHFLPDIRHDTYITCLSEHCPSEDEHGRLSMWRAYGGVGNPGVAIIINNTPFMRETDGMGVYSSPVSYSPRDQFAASFRGLIKRISDECEYIKSVNPEVIHNVLFATLLGAAICSKHEGFKEEVEWRVFCQPKLFPDSVVTRSIKAIRGVPQPVYILPLKNDPAKNILAMEIPEIVHRIIVGPTAFPLKIFEAFIDELTAAGCPNAHERVVISGIPLRT